MTGRPTPQSTPASVRADSPLAWLRARRDADGRPMIDDAAFAAGERLRRDFALAALGGRTTMDWSAMGTVVDRSAAGSRGFDGPSAAATGASERVRRALEAVGVELAGPLADVCGLDLALPELEKRRGWPPRSGKVVLRLALAALARHYGFAREARGRAAATTRHWGAPGYRPRPG